jgi:hypothetical protein
MELIIGGDLLKKELVQSLLDEANEIVAIMAASRKSASQKIKKSQLATRKSRIGNLNRQLAEGVASASPGPNNQANQTIALCELSALATLSPAWRNRRGAGERMRALSSSSKNLLRRLRKLSIASN